MKKCSSFVVVASSRDIDLSVGHPAFGARFSGVPIRSFRRGGIVIAVAFVPLPTSQSPKGDDGDSGGPEFSGVAAERGCGAASVSWETDGRVSLRRDPMGFRSLLYTTIDDGATIVATTESAFPPSAVWVESPARSVVTFAAVHGQSALSVTTEPTMELSDWCGRRSPVVPPPCVTAADAFPGDGDVHSLVDAIFRSVADCVLPLLRPETSSVGLLFSGGLDSTVLAAALDRCLPQSVAVELSNVAFSAANSFEVAPDRVSGRRSLEDLQRINPARQWRFIPVDVAESVAQSRLGHVLDVCRPSDTYMDVTIGLAEWFAANAVRSEVLVVGQGSDEQFAGYTRHRAAFNDRSWEGLQEELAADMERLWLRNLGRDDRLARDCGKVPVMPFLDRRFMQFVNSLPLWHICDLLGAPGVGDKRLLRLAAVSMGLTHAAGLAKRAIQFGSRVAKIFKQEGVSGRQARGCGSVKFEQQAE